jgi:hypothetical protein
VRRVIGEEHQQRRREETLSEMGIFQNRNMNMPKNKTGCSILKIEQPVYHF